MKLTIILFIIIILNAFDGTAQMITLEQKGNKYFETFTYDKAITKYEETGIENLTTDGLRNLAESHRLIHNTEKAEEYYKVLSAKEDNKPEDLFMYAEMLLMNGKYGESELWMENFHERLTNDGRGEEYVAKKGEYKKLKEDIGRVTIFNLEINSDKQDFGPSFYLDKIVFASARKHNLPIKRVWNWNNQPYLNIYEATKDSNNQLENVTMLSKEVNKKFHEGPASYSQDGGLMVFTRNNYKEKSENGERKLTMHYRVKDEEGEWGEILDFIFNNKEYSVGHPSVTGNGKTIYFASNMPGGNGGTDIYKIEKQGDGWTTPINLGESINTEGNEMFPFIHSNNMLFFASDGQVGLGGLDIFVAKVEANNYSNIQNLGYPLNTQKDDFGLILDNQQKIGYFSSNRPGGIGSDDIYGFNLLKPFTFCTEIKGLAKDSDGYLLPGSYIALYSEEGDIIDTITVGNDAAYSFCVPKGSYKVTGTKEKYFDGSNQIIAKEGEKDPITADIILEKDPGFSLAFRVVNSKSKETLQGVKVTLIDNLTDTPIYFVTTLEDYQKALQGKKLNDRISYQIKLEKEGYFEKTVIYNQQLTKPGLYNVHESLDLSLDPAVKDLSELVKINPINFDLKKYNIRPDAATELDKIVEVMNKYPNMVVELGAHTDCRGSRKYNESLSDKRAKASAAYIKSKITDPDRIYGKGYGEERLLNNCECEGSVKSSCSEEEHSENRRTEFKVISTGNDKVKVKNTSTDSF